MAVLRRNVVASRAGSRRTVPGWCGRIGWRAWLAPAPKGFDDGHAATAAGTRWEPVKGLWRFDRLVRRCPGKQFSGTRFICAPVGTETTSEPAHGSEIAKEPTC